MKPQILYLTLRLSSDYILLLIRPSISWIIPACPQIRPLDRTILPVLYRRSSSPLTILKILLITFPLALYTKHDPKDQCPKELPDDQVRTYKKNVCPIVASSSESDMERCGSGIVPRRQSQPLRSNSSSKLTPLRYAPSCELYNTSPLVAGDRCPRFC